MKKAMMIAMVLFFTTQTMKAQTDYVLTNAKDTIKLEVIKWNYSKVTCMVNEKKVKYKAKDIIEFRSGKRYFEVGKICPTLIGFKRFMFLQRLITGKINLYGIGVTDLFSHTKKVGKVKVYSQTWAYVTVVYVRKPSDPNGKFQKVLGYKHIGRMTKDCEAYNKEFAAGASKWDYPFGQHVDYYNEHCK